MFGIIYYNTDDVFPNYEIIYKASTSFTIGNISSKVYSEDDDNIYYYSPVYNIDLIDDDNITLYSKILKLEETYETVLEKTGIDIEDESWDDLVSLSYNSDTKVISVGFKYTDSEIAEQVVEELVDILEQKISEINASYEIQSFIVIDENVTSIENSDAITFDLIKDAALLAIVGFLAICFIVVLIEVLENRISSEEDLEKVLKSKNLAVITDKNYESQIKIIRINTEKSKTMLITDSNGLNSNSNIAKDLAKSVASLDKKVILLDLENSGEKGLSDFLSSDDKFIEKYANKTDTKNLSIITLGSDIENIAELIESQKMIESLESLEKLFDKVIINSSNILNSPKTLAISKISKFTILNVKRRKEKLKNVLKAKRSVEDVGSQFLGTILYK